MSECIWTQTCYTHTISWNTKSTFLHVQIGFGELSLSFCAFSQAFATHHPHHPHHPYHNFTIMMRMTMHDNDIWFISTIAIITKAYEIDRKNIPADICLLLVGCWCCVAQRWMISITDHPRYSVGKGNTNRRFSDHAYLFTLFWVGWIWAGGSILCFCAMRFHPSASLRKIQKLQKYHKKKASSQKISKRRKNRIFSTFQPFQSFQLTSFGFFCSFPSWDLGIPSWCQEVGAFSFRCFKAVFQDEKKSAQAQKLSEDLDPTKSGMAGIPRRKFRKIRLNNGCTKMQKVW